MCAEFEDRVLAYADLTPHDRALVDSHLAGCAGCREFHQSLQAVDAALATSYSGVRVSDDFAEAVQRRVPGFVALSKPSAVPQVLDFVGWAAVIVMFVMIVRQTVA